MLATTGAHWTDYVSAFAAVVGILVALVAVVVAVKSAKDAKVSADTAIRTADAAESTSLASVETLKAAGEQLALAKTEHERLEEDRRRRPRVDAIQVSEIHARDGEIAPIGVFRIGVENRGDRDLDGALLTTLFDPGCPAVWSDRWGNLVSD